MSIGDITRTHGMSQTRFYKRWRAMIDRCNNPKTNAYKYYGAKGIRVCDEWSSFKPFHDWAISNGYKDGLSLDRIDTNGNYEPRNCRWVTQKEQCNNMTSNVFLTYKGVRKSQNQWAEYLGVSGEAIAYWRRKGLSDFDIIERFIKRRG